MTELNKIIKARSKLMRGHVGMASMLLHLDLVEVDASKCETLATDGRRIFYNPVFINEISEEELKGVLVHEALHCVYEHMLRRGKNRHPKVWNIACDYAINSFLVYDLHMELPEGGLLKRKYHRMTAEQIYRILINDEEALEESIDGIFTNPKPKGKPKGESEGESEGGSGGNPTHTKTGQKVGDIDLDSIPDTVGQVWDAQNEDGKPLTPSELGDLKSELQRAVSMSDKLEKSMSQDGTSSMGNRMKELKEVKLDWKDLLSDILQSTVANQNTWSRLNKRHSWRGVCLPSKTTSPYGGELVVAIDTSGSVSQYELNVYGTEIQAMAEDCGIERIRVCYCDTTVRKNADGEWWYIFDLDQGDELTLRARGGGGTHFDPPFNLYNDYSDDTENVQAFIYFTDGYGRASQEVEPDIPVIWCVTHESSWSERLPFGEVIYVDTAEFY